MGYSALNFQVARIHRLKDKGRIKAFVDLRVGEELLLKGLRIVEGKNGLFISMPQQKGKDNKWYDTVRCLSQDVRQLISENILEAYESQKV